MCWFQPVQLMVALLLFVLPVAADDVPRPPIEATADGDSPTQAGLKPAADSLTTGEVVNWFRAHYRLEPGRVFKRVPHGPTPHRLRYYQLYWGRQAESIPEGPTAMWFKFSPGDNEASRDGGSFGGDETTVDQLTGWLMDVPDHQVMGPDALRRLGLKGDFVFDPAASQEQMRAALEQELQLNGHDIQLTFREVERDVYVCRGKLDFRSLPAGRDPNTIEFYGPALDLDAAGYGGGAGHLNEMLQNASRWIQVPIINEATDPESRQLFWHLNDDLRFTPNERKLARDPETVLTNLTVQTGLTFTPERRNMRTLVVEPRGASR